MSSPFLRSLNLREMLKDSLTGNADGLTKL
jgi:hypothetical protein